MWGLPPGASTKRSSPPGFRDADFSARNSRCRSNPRRDARILRITGRPRGQGQFLEPQRPAWRMDVVIVLRDIRRQLEAPFIFEKHRRGVLVQEIVGRPFLDDGKKFVPALEGFLKAAAQCRRPPFSPQAPILACALDLMSAGSDKPPRTRQAKKRAPQDRRRTRPPCPLSIRQIKPAAPLANLLPWRGVPG